MATTLRRRALPPETASEPASPRDKSPVEKGRRGRKGHTGQKEHDESENHKSRKVDMLHAPKGRKRRFGLFFILGLLFGLIVAGFLAKSNDLIDFPGIGELSMDSLLDVLPAGLVKDMRDLVVSCYYLNRKRA
jgi:phospholipid:diacylglycerol acyltransferase